MISAEREVNIYKTKWVIVKIKNPAQEFKKENNRKSNKSVYGLAFKPNINDLRESPALYVTKTLINDGLLVLAVEMKGKALIDTRSL